MQESALTATKSWNWKTRFRKSTFTENKQDERSFIKQAEKRLQVRDIKQKSLYLDTRFLPTSNMYQSFIDFADFASPINTKGYFQVAGSPSYLFLISWDFWGFEGIRKIVDRRR